MDPTTAPCGRTEAYHRLIDLADTLEESAGLFDLATAAVLHSMADRLSGRARIVAPFEARAAELTAAVRDGELPF